MILEYIHGTTLVKLDLKRANNNQLHHLYTQLADIFIQLRRFEFPTIGQFALSSCGEIEARRQPISNNINLQVIEGLQPLRIMEEHCHGGGLTSANDYVSMLLRMAWNAYETGKTVASNNDEASSDVFNLEMFSTFVQNKWLNPALDQGPFVLDHGDLGLYNIIIDEKTLDILAVLDWEWSRAIPCQFFVPPTWLSGLPLGIISFHGSIYDSHLDKLDMFRTILREREQKLYGGNTLLSDEWACVDEKAGILIPPALESWTFIDLVAERYLDPYLGGQFNDRTARIQALLDARPDYRAVVDSKIQNTIAYRALLRELGFEVSDGVGNEKKEPKD